MASTYSNTGIELIATGEQSGTWGQTTNVNWEMIEELATGVQSIALTGTTYTLTTTDGASSEGRHAVIVFTGSPGGTCTVTVSPNDMQKLYFIKNNSDETVTITQGSGATVDIEADDSAIVYCDGAGAGAAVNTITAGGGGATGGGGAIAINDTTADQSYTIATGTNGFSVGPVNVASGVTITIASGQRWVVI